MYDWQFGRNLGDVNKQVSQLVNQVDATCIQNEGKITLIGWSLGGVIARETARLRSEEIDQVITMGTPISGGPKYTSIGYLYAKLKGIDLDKFEQYVLAQNQLGLNQSVTSIYSKRDGVVGWQASLDTYNPQAKNVEVSSSHIGMVCNAQVWKTIAMILSRQAS